MNFAAIHGEWKFSKKSASFIGAPSPYTDTDGQKKMGLSSGLAVTNQSFAGGEISAVIEFTHLTQNNSCELIFYYEPVTRHHVTAGLGGPGSAYVIRYWNGHEWRTLAIGGLHKNLKAKQKYFVKVTVRGSKVALFVDEVEVLGATLPFALSTSQVGIFCLDSKTSTISDLAVQSEKGRVFVVMEFSASFNDIHEGVIKRVCDEFGLEARKADERHGPGIILEDIKRDIIESKFVIAEITPSNPNVYYELGYSDAVGKPVILLADRKLEKLPFDVSSFRVLFYENSIGGKSQFEEGLRKHINAIMAKDKISPNVAA